ncbi:hypothetical protein NG782_10525 [Aliarcobacter cryaerophilus]|uniref:hypothetical protein n=1 Tax=Aliarcobacter cryaerophilus TaxID=28198 RepID=UPI003DA37C28
MKFLLKYKKWILIILFIIPLLVSLYIQYDENIKKYDYWNYKVLEKLEIATKEEISKLRSEEDVANFKDSKKEIIRNFKPTSEQYKDYGCYKKFNTNTDESIDIIINSLGVLQFGRINDECFSKESKQYLFVSYLFIYIAISFTIIILFIDKIRRLIRYKNHSVVIGLNNNSRELISKLIAKKENIKIYENDSTNKYINELENSGEIIITGKLEYTIESNNCEIINAKEIFIINDSDAESLNNLALILSKFKHEKRKPEDKTKIYIEIKNRENKAFFDKKGIYDKLITDNYEIYPFSINEIIVQEMFKDKPLISNIKKEKNRYIENLKILIVGFNDLSEEILYNILKLGHFDLNKITEVTVIDDKYEVLSSKYKKIIENGKEPYENSNESLWKLEFLPYKSLYENRDFNRIILCDKELNNGIDILNYINNNYHVQIREKNTIIQVFNEHKNINKTINSDNNNFKNFSTFGDIETTVTLNNIQNNNLLKVAEYTNDFKETDESKKWKNIDNFTIESNITEKLHMNIKLHLFDLEFEKSNQKFEIIDSVKKFIDVNKVILENNFIEAIKLPYAKDLLKYHQLSDFDKFIKNNENFIEVAFVCSLVNFYLKIKNKPNYVEIIHQLAQIEHTRWNAYHILNGWKRMSKERKEQGKVTKDMIGKEHYDLCDWETLKKDDPSVVKYDYKNIYQIPFVAYCLGFEIVEIEEEI